MDGLVQFLEAEFSDLYASLRALQPRVNASILDRVRLSHRRTMHFSRNMQNRGAHGMAGDDDCSREATNGWDGHCCIAK